MAITYCNYCNSKIEKYQCLIDKGDHNFCNNKCFGLWNTGKQNSEKQKRVTSIRMQGNKYRLGKSPGNKKYYVYQDIFKNIDDEESAYWLGFILADGCVTINNGYRFSIISIDEDHLFKLKTYIGYTGNLVSYTKGTHTLNVNDKKFVINLINKDVVPRKTFKVKFPTNIKENLLNHFIRGYWDGDGSISFSTKCTYHNMYFSTTVLGTEDFIKNLGKTLKEKCNLKSDTFHKMNKIYVLKRSMKQANKICDYLYNNATIYLERKYKKYEDYLKYTKFRGLHSDI